MSNSTARARHRAEATNTTSIAAIAKSVGSNAGGIGRQAAVVAAASGLVLTGGVAANAAQPHTQPTGSAISGKVAAQPANVAAPAALKAEVKMSQAAGAAVPDAPLQVASNDIQQKQTPKAKSEAAPAAVAKTAPAAMGAGNTMSAGKGMGAGILQAAYAQIGVNQDCTALVSNSLAAVGIHFHDWPAGYQSLGRLVSQSEAQPGDLVYYANGGTGVAHIAVYAGNGQAIHGGFEGTTKLFSVNVGGGPTSFIAMGH